MVRTFSSTFNTPHSTLIISLELCLFYTENTSVCCFLSNRCRMFGRIFNSTLHTPHSTLNQVLAETDTLHHFGISFFYAAEVSSETVLVKLFVGLDVPEAAGVG